MSPLRGIEQLDMQQFRGQLVASSLHAKFNKGLELILSDCNVD